MLAVSMRRPGVALPSLAVLLLGTACRPAQEVTRVVDGRTIDGRFVSADAYAAYLDGTMRAERGDEAGAASAFRAALAEDPDSGEVWARLGAALCLREPKGADDALARAEQLAPELDGTWLALSDCAFRRGDAARARVSAERAVALSPDSPEATLAVIRALERLGDAARAAAWRRAYSTRTAVALGAAPGGRLEQPPSTSEAVDRAIESGDAATARRLAVRARLPVLTVARRALSLGAPGVAVELARTVAAADPADTDARIVTLVAADLARDEATFLSSVSPLAEDRTPPTPDAASLMHELLERRVGAEAARAWLEAWTRARTPTETPTPPAAERAPGR
jgi:tetratricopeptide (TPR) repeat protein